MSKRRWLLAIVSLLLAVCATAAYLVGKDRSVPSDGYVVRVGFKPNSGYQNYFVADARGIFAKHRVRIEGVTFKSTNQMVQALALGQLDATAAGSLEVAASLAADNPNALKVYLTLVFDQSNAFFSIVAPPDSAIRDLAGLSGKRIGVLPGSTASAWLRVSLQAEGVDPMSVELVQMDSNVQLQALVTGQVDALYTMDPIVTMAKVRGIGRVVVKGPENRHILDPMANAGGMISTRMLTDHPDAAMRFIAAMYETVDFMRSHPTETRAIIADRTRLDATVADQMDLIQYWKVGETDFALVQKYLDFLVDHGILKQPVSARALYIDPDLVK